MADTYRPDIDGLRAIAVISVVLYHIGLPVISAGFVGVDVFFVISGYLITAQLWSSREKPLVALLLDFYARRARRILPPLAIVVIATLALGKLFLLPNGEQQDLAKSGIASGLFVSNVFFWLQASDYFAGPAQLQPLLHTWSLAVEEQFYLLWPPLLVALWTLARHWPRWHAKTVVCVGIASISLLSLALSIAWSATNPGAAFFLMPSRLWELGSGAALAMMFGKRDAAKLPIFAGLAGLVGIIAAVLLYTRNTPFPGAAALLPVAGTAAVIAAGAQRKTGLAYRMLASRPMTLTGEISYSWYLWHWPLLAVGRALDMGAHEIARDSALALLAYLLAYLSTRYLETPIRKKRVALFSAVRASLLTGFCLLSLTVLLSLALWIPARAYYRSDLAPASLSCIQQHGVMQLDSEGPCILAQGGHAEVFLVGDSHANHWSPAIATWAKIVDARAIERSFSSCPVLLTRQHSQNEIPTAAYPKGCATFSQQVMTEIVSTAAGGRPTAVILSANWQAYPTSTIPGRRIFANNLDEVLAALETANTRVLVIGPTPRFAYAIPACVVRRDAHICRITRTQHNTETQAANAMLTAIVARHPHTRLWDPTSQYCDALYCYPNHNGSLMFRDGDHLSRRGAEAAGPNLKPDLDWLLQTPSEVISP